MRLKIRSVYSLVYMRKRLIGRWLGMVGCFTLIIDIVITLIAGGLGLRIISPFWRRYFYSCEYGADWYAASLGQGEVLARIVDDHNTPLDVPFEWMWGREGTSKYVQKRLALLRQQPSISTELGS